MHSLWNGFPFPLGCGPLWNGFPFPLGRAPARGALAAPGAGQGPRSAREGLDPTQNPSQGSVSGGSHLEPVLCRRTGAAIKNSSVLEEICASVSCPLSDKLRCAGKAEPSPGFIYSSRSNIERSRSGPSKGTVTMR